MKVLLAAIEATGGNTNADVLREALLKVEINLPTGHFKFHPGRVPMMDLRVAQIQKVGGKKMWVPVKVTPAAEPYIQTYP
jgi:ABC-type branched-subunit amino acid transport system substrate-binding protein